jgi:hypothetical protein
MMLKKIIISSVVVSSLLVGVMAVAQTTTAPSSTSTMPMMSGQEMMLQVGPKGNVLLRGTVDAVATGSLTVKGWGGDWTVNISSSTKLMPSDITQFKVGDFVGVQGTVSQTSSWTIDAMLVKDRVSGGSNPEGKNMMQGKNEGQNDQGAGMPMMVSPQNNQQGTQGIQGSPNNQAIQQQIQSILDQINKIRAQLQTQQSTQPGQ